MQSIYEMSSEYKEVFTTTKKMGERNEELNRLECEQRMALSSGPMQVEGNASPRELALQVLHGESITNSKDADFEKMRSDYAKTKVDLEILQRGMFSQHELVRLLRDRVSAKRMKQDDVRRVAEKVSKAARDMAIAQEAMRKLCDEVQTAGFESNCTALLFSIEPNVTVTDALEVYAKRVRYIAGMDES
jgi:hypothetical protein